MKEGGLTGLHKDEMQAFGENFIQSCFHHLPGIHHSCCCYLLPILSATPFQRGDFHINMEKFKEKPNFFQLVLHDTEQVLT